VYNRTNVASGLYGTVFVAYGREISPCHSCNRSFSSRRHPDLIDWNALPIRAVRCCASRLCILYVVYNEYTMYSSICPAALLFISPWFCFGLVMSRMYPRSVRICTSCLCMRLHMYLPFTASSFRNLVIFFVLMSASDSRGDL